MLLVLRYLLSIHTIFLHRYHSGCKIRKNPVFPGISRLSEPLLTLLKTPRSSFVISGSGGSSPSISSTLRRSARAERCRCLFEIKVNMEEFPSGQRGQTVNLLRFGGSNQPSSTEKTAWLLRPCRFCYVPKHPKTEQKTKESH